MKYLYRISSCLALAALLIAQLAGCGNDSAGKNTDQASTDSSDAASVDDTSGAAADPAADDLPSTLDFGGKEFRIMTFDQSSLTWARSVMDVAEQSADTISDAIYHRNRAVEERLNVKITELTRNYGDNDLQKMRNWIMSDEDPFEVGMEFVGNSRTLAEEGLLVDYNDLQYVDLDKEYWCHDLNSSTSILGKRYLVYGDYSLSTHDNTSVLIFNKKLYEDLNFGDNMYSLVRDGKWTFDTMGVRMTAASTDLNGDSVMDDQDRYGYVASSKEVLPSFIISGGEMTIRKDEQDVPYLAMDGNSHFAEVFGAIFDLVWTDNRWYDTNGNGDGVVSKIFENGNALYSHTTLYSIETLRAMDTDFGIIPYPKYEESQAEYYSRVGGGMFGVIPNTNRDLDMTGAVLEALCSEARKTVIPAYYDIMLSYKLTRDSDSAEMIDTIFANRVYDLGDTFWVALIRDGQFASMMQRNKRDIASTIERIRGSVNNAIDKTVEAFRATAD